MREKGGGGEGIGGDIRGMADRVCGTWRDR